MEDFYKRLFLVGKAEDGNLVFAKVDTDFKIEYIKTKSFFVDFIQLEVDIRKLEKREVIEILFLATDGLETILDGTEQGCIILSKIYKDFLLHDVTNFNDKEIEVYVKSYDENFEIVEYFQKERIDKIIKACEEKDDFKLENETNWNSLFDDLSDIKKGKYITKIENSKKAINPKDDFLTAFSKLLDNYNIKF